MNFSGLRNYIKLMVESRFPCHIDSPVQSPDNSSWPRGHNGSELFFRTQRGVPGRLNVFFINNFQVRGGDRFLRCVRRPVDENKPDFPDISVGRPVSAEVRSVSITIIITIIDSYNQREREMEGGLVGSLFFVFTFFTSLELAVASLFLLLVLYF